jgi:hypothetical protein
MIITERTQMLSQPRSAHLAFLSLAIVLLAFHFVHLSADFPSSIDILGENNWSGDKFTDEGLHGAAATSYALGRDWYVKGDLNVAISLPVLSLMEYPVFKLFGVSLITARALLVLLFSCTVIMLYLLARKYEGSLAASIIACLLCANFLCFSFSRLAILECAWVFFVVAALFIYAFGPGRSRSGVAVVAGLLISVAALTKLTALCGIAPLVILICVSERKLRRSVVNSALAIASCTAVLLAHRYLALRYFPREYAYYYNLNLTTFGPSASNPAGSAITLAVVPKLVARTIYWSHYVDPVVFGLCLLAMIWFAVRWREMIRRPFVLIMVTWLFANIAILSTRSYSPPRYFVNLAVPMTAVAVLAALDAWKTRRLLGVVALAALCGSFVANSLLIFRYLAQPQYSFYSLALEVRRQVVSKDRPAPLIMGSFTPTLTMINGIPTLYELGSETNTWKVRTYKPQYLVDVYPLSPEISQSFRDAGADLELSSALMCPSMMCPSTPGEGAQELRIGIYKVLYNHTQ